MSSNLILWLASVAVAVFALGYTIDGERRKPRSRSERIFATIVIAVVVSGPLIINGWRSYLQSQADRARDEIEQRLSDKATEIARTAHVSLLDDQGRKRVEDIMRPYARVRMRIDCVTGTTTALCEPLKGTLAAAGIDAIANPNQPLITPIGEAPHAIVISALPEAAAAADALAASLQREGFDAVHAPESQEDQNVSRLSTDPRAVEILVYAL